MNKKSSIWYFETSAFNHFLKSITFEAFLNTRELQNLQNRVVYISPIVIWELMITKDDFESDFLIFSAQNFFSEKLLATPTELIIRYIKNAYPENKLNYDIHTKLEIGNIWSKMTEDNEIKFEYNKKNLIEKISFTRNISKNLLSIINSDIKNNDKTLLTISHTINVFYECLERDNFLPKTSKYNDKLLFKLVVLFALLIFVFKMDIDTTVISNFSFILLRNGQ